MLDPAKGAPKARVQLTGSCQFEVVVTRRGRALRAKWPARCPSRAVASRMQVLAERAWLGRMRRALPARLATVARPTSEIAFVGSNSYREGVTSLALGPGGEAVH
jgi:hypothetical protein